VLGGSRTECLRWTPGNVKLLLSPRQSRGITFLIHGSPYCASGERGKRQDLRYNPQIKRYYQRKRAKTKGVIATKAVAHKLARACYYILRDGSEFDVNRAFA
jgi:hypothetical protein